MWLAKIIKLRITTLALLLIAKNRFYPTLVNAEKWSQIAPYINKILQNCELQEYLKIITYITKLCKAIIQKGTNKDWQCIKQLIVTSYSLHGGC